MWKNPRARAIVAVLAIIALLAPLGTAARPRDERPSRGPEASPRDRVRPSPRSERANIRAVLREERHAVRLARVEGIIRGMIHKLENLSQRLDRQLAATKRRIEHLRQAGHTITVDAELGALQSAVTRAKDQIASVIGELRAIPDSERPRNVVPTVREKVRSLRSVIQEVRKAFKTLRDAVRDDIRATQPSPSPSPAPTPTP